MAKDEGNLPKYLLLENVKNLVGKKFKSQFDNWLFYLDELGYNTYWQVLNAKDYGIPQNRERVFAISIRKDLNETYEFPKPEELKLRLKDILEDEVDEKYYLDDEKVKNFIKTLENIEIPCIAVSRGRYTENESTQQKLELNTSGTTNTITTVQKDNYVIEAKIQQVEGNLYPNSGNPQAGRVYKPDGISPALDTCQGGNRMPKIIQIGSIPKEVINDNERQRRVYSDEGLSPVILARTDSPKIIIDDTQGFDGIRTYENYAPTLRAQRSGLKTIDGIRIRKLTPLECWRLMGFDDEDFNKAQKSGVSNTQLYKQAGNSIVVNVLEKLFKNLYRK